MKGLKIRSQYKTDFKHLIKINFELIESTYMQSFSKCNTNLVYVTSHCGVKSFFNLESTDPGSLKHIYKARVTISCNGDNKAIYRRFFPVVGS